MIAVDLSDIPAATVRHVPLNAWFRFRRVVEDTPTILMLIEQEPNAKTCASLVLRVGFERAQWMGTASENRVGDFCCANSSACLLGGAGKMLSSLSAEIKTDRSPEAASRDQSSVFASLPEPLASR